MSTPGEVDQSKEGAGSAASFAWQPRPRTQGAAEAYPSGGLGVAARAAEPSHGSRCLLRDAS
eukprot:11917631-Alexandrium_andersonii.AAC.1